MRHLKTLLIFSLIAVLLMGCGDSTNTTAIPLDTPSGDQKSQDDTSPPIDTPSPTPIDRTNQILLPVLWTKWLKPDDPSDTSSIASLDLYLFDPETEGLTLLMTHGEKDWFTVQDEDGSQAIWSPDKQQIAFLDGILGTLFHDLYVINADGSGLKKLNEDPDIYFSNIQWTPDGKHIVFEHQHLSTTDSKISMIDVDSGEITVITQDVPGNQFNPAVSPDGQRVAFISNENLAVYLIDIDGENLQQITGELVTSYLPVWHPNGEWLLYYGEDYQTYKYDISSGESSLLIDQNSDYKEHFAFSPDGTKLAYTSSLLEMEEIGLVRGESSIHVYDLSSGEITVITDNKGTGLNDAFPVWSPDSSQLLFQHWIMETTGEGYTDISLVELFLVNADGSGLTKLLVDIEVPGVPDW